jgi:hypothetical protein
MCRVPIQSCRVANRLRGAVAEAEAKTEGGAKTGGGRRRKRGEGRGREFLKLHGMRLQRAERPIGPLPCPLSARHGLRHAWRAARGMNKARQPAALLSADPIRHCRIHHSSQRNSEPIAVSSLSREPHLLITPRAAAAGALYLAPHHNSPALQPLPGACTSHKCSRLSHSQP